MTEKRNYVFEVKIANSEHPIVVIANDMEEAILELKASNVLRNNDILSCERKDGKVIISK